jgi:hypothetical protein
MNHLYMVMHRVNTEGSIHKPCLHRILDHTHCMAFIPRSSRRDSNCMQIRCAGGGSSELHSIIKFLRLRLCMLHSSLEGRMHTTGKLVHRQA